MHAQVHSQRTRGTKEDPPRPATSHVLIGQRRKPRGGAQGPTVQPGPPLTSYNNNNRPREVPDRPISRSRAQNPRERAKAGVSPPHFADVARDLAAEPPNQGRLHALFHVSLSLTTCAVTWPFGPVPFGVLGPQPPPNGLVWGSLIGSRRRFLI